MEVLVNNQNNASNTIPKIGDRISSQQGHADDKGDKTKPNSNGVGKGYKYYGGAKGSAEVVDRYLLLLARLENGINNSQLTIGEKQELINSLATKLESISGRDLEHLKTAPEYVDMPKNSNQLRQFLNEKITNPNTRLELLNYLKSKSLVLVLKGESPVDLVYTRVATKSATINHFKPAAPATRHALINSGYHLSLAV